jgi:hypothetical protein
MRLGVKVLDFRPTRRHTLLDNTQAPGLQEKPAIRAPSPGVVLAIFGRHNLGHADILGAAHPKVKKTLMKKGLVFDGKWCIIFAYEWRKNPVMQIRYPGQTLFAIRGGQ